MTLAGVAGVQARIAQIQQRYQPGAFDEALRAALGPGTPARAAPAAPPPGAGTATFAAAGTPVGCRCAVHAGVRPAAAGPTAPTGRVGRVDPPAELQLYGNGRIPAEALQPIGVGQHRLWAPAAAAFRQMRHDASLQGVHIGVTDSYRSYEEQVDVAARKGLYSEGGLAATPGTSTHGWGLSLDLDLDSRAQEWMRAHGWRYGFVEDVPREPWHWTYHGR